MNPLLWGVLSLVVLLALFVIGIHYGFRIQRPKPLQTPQDYGFKYESVRIPTAHDKQLHAWFLPALDATQTVVIAHGWGAHAELMLPLAVPFRNAGLNVLLFDARNHGQSDGHGYSSLPRFAEDIEHVLAWLQTHRPDACDKMALLGHSVGASASILVASRNDRLDALISISAFGHPEWVMARYWQKLFFPKWLARGLNRYVEWLIGSRFVDIAPIHTITRVQCPVLLVHGLADTVVPIADARAIAQASLNAHVSIQLCEIADADHASVDKIDAHQDTLIQFLRLTGFHL